MPDPTVRKYIDKRTILEKALAVPVHKLINGKVNLQEVEVALAWLQGKVSISQIAIATNTNPGTAQAKMSKLLRQAYGLGRLIVKE